MNRSFSARPKPANNNAKIFFALTLFLSAVAFAFYFFMDRYKGIVGTVGLFILVTAILIYTKYISPSFSYDVYPDADDVPVFVVRQLIGKRITTLCRIELADIISVKRETRAEAKAHKTPKEYRKYVYAPTLFPPEIYRLTVNSRYEKAEIVIEISAELCELLNSLINEAKELRAASPDEY